MGRLPRSRATPVLRELLEQLGDELLRLVGLCESGYAGLAQDLEFRHVRSCLTVVGSRHVVLRGQRVGGLRGHHVANCGQRVDVGADGAAIGGNRGNRLVDRRQCTLRTRGAGQAGSRQGQ